MQNKSIFLVGAMGAGKSTVGKKLSELLRLPFFDTDQILANKHNASITEIFKTHGVDYFREQEQKLIIELTHNQNTIIATGGGCVVDDKVRKCLFSLGLVCYLQVNPLQQLKRNLDPTHRPSLPLDIYKHLNFFKDMHAARSSFYDSIAHLTVDTNNFDADTVANIIGNNINILNR